MEYIIDYINFAAIAILINVMSYRVLLYLSLHFGYDNNPLVKAKLYQFGFVYKFFKRPVAFVLCVASIIALNLVAYKF